MDVNESSRSKPLESFADSAIRQRKAVVDWALKHPGTAGGFILLVTSVVKLMLVSRQSLPTALALATDAGVPTILLASLLSVTPILLAFLLVQMSVWVFYIEPRTGRDIVPAVRFYMILLLGYVLVPVDLLVAGLVGVVVGVAAQALRSRVKGTRRQRDPQFPGSWGSYLFALVVAAYAAYIALPVMWVPAETLTYADGSRQVGYVVRNEQGWITVLTEDTREIERRSASSLVGRKICEASGQNIRRSLAQWIRDETPLGYEKCPTPRKEKRAGVIPYRSFLRIS